MTTLAAAVEADLLLQAVQATPNIVGTAGSIPTSMKTFSQARAKLQRNLAPTSPRYMMMSDEVNVELVDSTKAQFNPAAEVEKMFYEGSLGKAQGAGWYECINLPTITNGTRAGSITVSGAGSAPVSHAGTGPGQIAYAVCFNLWTQFQMYPPTSKPQPQAWATLAKNHGAAAEAVLLELIEEIAGLEPGDALPQLGRCLREKKFR